MVAQSTGIPSGKTAQTDRLAPGPQQECCKDIRETAVRTIRVDRCR